MPTCLLHPEREAERNCEYCAQPHCGACLQPVLGRWYCPECAARVRTVATGVRQAPTTAAGPAGQGSASAAAPAGARLPGWLSGLLYLAGFFVLDLLLMGVTALPLVAAHQFAKQVTAVPVRADNPLHPGALPLPVWALLFGLITWGTFLGILAFTGLMARGVERRSLVGLGLPRTRRIVRDLVVGLALSGLLFVTVVGIGMGRGWYVLHSFRLSADTLLIPLAAFLILLPAAATEEISMRGYVLQATARSWGRAGGVAASTLAFALLHGANPHVMEHPLAFAGLVLAGLYLASAYLITGNLWLAIFLHAGWNVMEGPVFGLPISGMDVPVSVFRTTPAGDPFWSGGAFGPEAGLGLCLLMLLHLAMLWLLRPWLAAERAPAAASGEEVRVYAAIPLGRSAD